MVLQPWEKIKELVCTTDFLFVGVGGGVYELSCFDTDLADHKNDDMSHARSLFLFIAQANVPMPRFLRQWRLKENEHDSLTTQHISKSCFKIKRTFLVKFKNIIRILLCMCTVISLTISSLKIV
jgi:hypothetical protein